MHEHFELDVGAFLADLLDLVEAQLARKDDAHHAHLLPELHSCPVHGVGLHREVDGHFGPFFAHHHDQARVGHDQAVGLHGNHRLDVAQVGAHLVVVRQQVAGDKKLLVADVGFFNADLDLLQPEFVVARTQGVARLTGVYRVGAEVIGRTHFVQRAGRQEQFRGLERHASIVHGVPLLAELAALRSVAPKLAPVKQGSLHCSPEQPGECQNRGC